MVERVSEGLVVKTCMPERPVTWESLSRRIHVGLVSDDNEKQEQLVMGYARVWRQFASDFMNPQVNMEYNCIKHGFRAKSGGLRSNLEILRIPAATMDRTSSGLKKSKPPPITSLFTSRRQLVSE